MILKNIDIKNFRNLFSLKIDFHPNFNFLYGKNGQGKTSILEAIYILANLKSFRNAKNSDFISFNNDRASIISVINFNDYENTYKLQIEKDLKRFFINNKKPKYLNEYYGNLKAIVFNPDDINIIKGYPQQRRALLDRAIFLSSSNYLNKIIYFNKCLKKRNFILKKNSDDIDIYTDIFIKSSIDIYAERINYINRIQPIFYNIYNKINDNNETPEISFKYNNINLNNIIDKLRYDLKNNKNKEKEFGQTLYGPHRDDFLFLLNNVPIKKFGSQGQQKSFMLAFKSAQVIDIKKETGVLPILLLDDMASELDIDRQEYFYEFLFKHE